MLESARRLLVCLHYGIGDVIMQSPVLEALRAFIPNASISLLGARPALELFDDDPRWQGLQSVQAWGLRHWGDPGNPITAAAIEAWIERQGFDLFVDVSHAVQAVREVIWSRRRAILDTAKFLPACGINGVEALKKSALHGWGLPVPPALLPRMTLSKERRRAADAFFRKRAGNGKPPLGVSTVASSSLKRWPPGRLAEVAEGLAERSGRQIMIFAGPQERASTDLVAHLKNSGPVLQANNLHLLDTAALLERCALLICNDTGLMHMAGAVGTPLVALFGPTAEAIYLPPCPACKGFSSALACPYRKTGVFGPSVCLVQGRCLIKKRSCIETIPAEAVLSAAAQMLAEPPAPERHG